METGPTEPPTMHTIPPEPEVPATAPRRQSPLLWFWIGLGAAMLGLVGMAVFAFHNGKSSGGSTTSSLGGGSNTACTQALDYAGEVFALAAQGFDVAGDAVQHAARLDSYSLRLDTVEIDSINEQVGARRAEFQAAAERCRAGQ